MKWNTALAIISATFATVAYGQSATGTGTVGASGTGAEVDITLTGNVTSAVQLSVTTGTGTPKFTAYNSPATGAATATLDFGTFTTADGAAGSFMPIKTRATDAAGKGGAAVAGTLSATITFSGATKGSVQIARASLAPSSYTGNTTTAGDVPANDLRWADATAGSAVWATPFTTGNTNNVNDPGSATELCPNPTTTGCTSPTTLNTNIGVFVPDSQPAGLFSTVVVYTATAS